MKERLIGGAVVALALASCGGGGGDAPVCENPRAVTTVAMGDFFYEPGCVEAAPGTELEIVNEGNAPHTFTVEAGDMTKDLAVLIGPEQKWLTTNQFLDRLDGNLKAAMAG